MCGIAGIFGKSEESTLKEMLSVLSHRGPDDEFLVTGKNFNLGSRRLSIIDLENGRQPMSNENENILVAQNGEIYNFANLKKNLKEHNFRTKSDTEVIVHLYEEMGESFVNLINGMFAIAIWDSKKNKGILIRDRVGQKPLYYTFQNKVLYFASEIKSLLCIPNFKRKINFEALYHYLSYKHIPCPLSIFDGINQVPPGSILTFSPASNKIQIKNYWKADFSPKITDIKRATDGLLEHLKESIRLRLVSDVPVGFFLSGGLDSSLVASIAAKERAIKTFTLTYPDKPNEGKLLDEEYARVISKKYGTEHFEEPIKFSYFPKEFPKIISHFDEPFSGTVSTYFLSKLISKHVKVVISGDGADELLGSYLSHRMAIERESKEQWKWRSKLFVFTEEEKKKLYSTAISLKNKVDTNKHLKNYFNRLTARDPLNRILEAEFKSFLPDQVMTFVDRLSMAHSLEVRSPYLDHNFVNFVGGISDNLKIKDGETKYVLKQAALKYLPKEIVFRKKEGFVTPTRPLIKEVEDYVRETLSLGNLKEHGLFKKEVVNKLLNNFYNKKNSKDIQERLSYKILNLLSFQVWYNLYMKK